MGVELRPLAASFGVEVVGLDVRAGASDTERGRVVDAFFGRHLVLVRDQQRLSIDEQLAFASWFGTIRTPSSQIHPHLRDTDLRYTYLSNTRETAPAVPTPSSHRIRITRSPNRSVRSASTPSR